MGVSQGKTTHGVSDSEEDHDGGQDGGTEGEIQEGWLVFRVRFSFVPFVDRNPQKAVESLAEIRGKKRKAARSFSKRNQTPRSKAYPLLVMRQKSDPS